MTRRWWVKEADGSWREVTNDPEFWAAKVPKVKVDPFRYSPYKRKPRK